MKKSTKYELLLLVTAMIWGIGFPVTKIAIDNGFGPFAILLGRFGVASVLLTCIFWKQVKKIRKATIIYGTYTGALLFVGFAFQTLGIAYTSPSNNAFITQMMVIFVPFISWVMFKTKPKRYAFLGAFIAFLGSGILTYSGSLSLSSINIGDFLTFLCAIIVAAHIVVSTMFVRKSKIDPIGFSVVQFITAAIFSAIIAFAFEDVSRETSMEWLPIIYLGVMNTAFGFTIQTFAHKYSNPTRTSIIASTEALFAVVFSYVILSTQPTFQVVVGGAIILLAVLYVELSDRNEGVIT